MIRTCYIQSMTLCKVAKLQAMLSSHYTIKRAKRIAFALGLSVQFASSSLIKPDLNLLRRSHDVGRFQHIGFNPFTIARRPHALDDGGREGSDAVATVDLVRHF